MIDVKKQLNSALSSGDVWMGSNKAVESLLYDKPKLVLLSRNCPRKQTETISYYCRIAEVPCVVLQQSSSEVGSGIGRPHPVSAVSIIDEGESTILEVGK